MVECVSTMVLVSAAAVSSFFLATAAFFRGFTDPVVSTSVRRSTRPPVRPTPAPTVLGLRLGTVPDPLAEEAAISSASVQQNVHQALGSHGLPGLDHHHDESLFPSRLDNLDLQRFLGNRRLVRNYVGCVLNTKPCTAEGKEFKKALPDVLLTECSKCSDQMRNNIVSVVQALERDYPREWAQLVRQYDPDGLHRRRYAQYLRHRELNDTARAG